jgi:UDP-GlcNAc:undecaprenyl-phosphate/decaprenyl-phosphate GlcNAc-1-phosphate transferase
MYSLLFLACSSFLLSLVLTPLCRNLFRRLNLVDHPDQRRKYHNSPVPHLGGIPIALSYLAACGLLILTPLKGGLLVSRHLDVAWKLLPAAAVVFVTGILDDLIALKPWQKLAGQLLAASIAWWAGVRILGISGFSTAAWVGIPLTLIWLLGSTNAFNLIDGVDGLAAGIGLFATVTMVLASLLLQSNVPLALATVPLAGSLLGFLRYNFNPASIFLGDSGSLLIGFLLGCYGVIWTQKSATILAMTAPLMAMAVPLLDTGLSILRRFLRRQPIFRADRGHIHHRLLDRGLKPRAVTLILYAFCGMGAVFSLVESADHSPAAGAAIVLFCAATWVGVQYLGYPELDVARRMLTSGSFRNHLNAHLALRNFEHRLLAARSVDDYWQVIHEAARTFGFTEVSMSVAGTIYFERQNSSPRQRVWTLRLPLSATDYLSLGQACESPAPAILAPFLGTLLKVLPARIAELEQASSGPLPSTAAVAGL